MLSEVLKRNTQNDPIVEIRPTKKTTAMQKGRDKASRFIHPARDSNCFQSKSDQDSRLAQTPLNRCSGLLPLRLPQARFP
jgi:hypothetical protein